MMKYIKYLITFGVFILVFFSCGCIDNNDPEPIVMTFGELIEDFNSVYNWEASYQIDNFNTLEEGDILIIRDQIHTITYKIDEGITQIEFNSSKGLENFFPIDGNITGAYSVADIVEIHLKIIKVKFATMREGQLITVERETYKEGWNDITNSYIPVPSEYISFAEITS